MTTNPTLKTFQTSSPAPWSYAYSPYTTNKAGSDSIGARVDQIPAYELFDADGNKIFDTNEDTPAALQEANATLAAVAPELLEAVQRCVLFLADHDESDGEEGEIFRMCVKVAERAINGFGQHRDEPRVK